MIFALLTVLIIGLALYETGYGVTNTWFKSLRKQLIVQSSAAASFVLVAHSFFPESVLSPTSLAVNFGFLSMLAYIATATIRDCHLTAIASATVGGILFPLILHFTSSYLPSIHYVDHAGAGLIHFVGGIVAFIASLYASKVMNRSSGIVVRPYSATVGFLLLWAGWIAYVAVISAPVLQANVEMWLRGIINMSTATAWGAMSAVGYMWIACNQVKMRTCTVGGLAGMVAMSADPFSTPFWGAMVIGSLGGIAAVIVYGQLCKYKIADPSNAISIHLIPGGLGLMLVPIFNAEAFLTSQIMGASLLMMLASSMGVLVCEIHNLSKKSYPIHS